MIPGATGDAGHFDKAADVLASNHTVITYDRRGNSRSQSAEPASLDRQADDAAALLRHLGAAPAVVFGTSGGAIIALKLAIRSDPEKSRPRSVSCPLTRNCIGGTIHDTNMPTRQLVRKHTGRRSPRVYRQGLRARQADANTGRIVSASIGLIKTARRVADVTLDDVSRESGVTVRTILRRFGSRDGVFEAAFDQLKDDIRSLRRHTSPGDVDAAVTSLLDQYEQMGDLNIRALEEEDQLALLHSTLEIARRSHRDWLRHIFAPHLDHLRSDERERRITALYAATDIYLWKLLRRDLKLDRGQTEDTVRCLIRGVLAENIHTL